MEKSPSNLYFNNVISMGVSYSWERQSESAGFAQCTGLNHGENNFVKRSKSLDLEVLNLDLNNAGGSAIANIANVQNKYVDTDSVRIYANDMFAGKGRLSDFSINEGSLSNESITNLTYEVSTEEKNYDQEENPVSRDEEITVSRDIKGKTYSIEHSYSINFGSDFDFVSNHPLYKNNPSYASVEGRLALGENEANSALYQNPVDYGEYIDLSNYATEKGWDLAKMEAGCSGVFSSSSYTKDYINGNYSLTKTIELRYTGEDLEDNKKLYEIEYSMSWSEETRNNSTNPCAVVNMDGTIRGIAKNCSSGSNASIYAESGYNVFVSGGQAKQKAVEFFNYIKGNIDSVPTGDIHDTMFNLKKEECNPSVEREGTKNNGEIKFSFEMNNCPNYDITNSSNVSNSTSSKVSYNECNGKKIKITENTASIQVTAGNCFLNIDENGNYQKYDSIKDSINEGDAKSKVDISNYIGEYRQRYKIRSETVSDSPYQGSKSYSVTYSDAPDDDECGGGVGGCDAFNTKIKDKEKKTRYLDSNAVCDLQYAKGANPPTRSVSTSINYPKTGCDPLTMKDLADKIEKELLANKPDCAVQSASWSVNKDGNGKMQGNGSINGIKSS